MRGYASCLSSQQQIMTIKNLYNNLKFLHHKREGYCFKLFSSPLFSLRLSLSDIFFSLHLPAWEIQLFKWNGMENIILHFTKAVVTL